MAAPRPPRPARWERLDLKNERSYFTSLPTLYRHVSQRLARSLASLNPALFPGGGPLNIRQLLENATRSRVIFDSHSDWDAYALLGLGGFGRAVLWARQGQNGVIQDEIVVKEERDPQPAAVLAAHLRYTEGGTMAFRGLRSEAVIQSQMNDANCENIVHLRGYAYMSNVHQPTAAGQAVVALPANDVGNYRFYLEYAPYQTLEQLINRYRAWDTLIPEAFLWHVFDSLAAALQVLAQGPERKFSSVGRTRRTARFWPRDHEVVHLDIKPNNIFLGYETWKDHSTDVTGGSALLGWPVIKLGDFGAADITGASEGTQNLDKNWWKGNVNYQAPENAFLGVDWVPPLSNHNDHHANVPPPVVRQDYINAEIANPGFHYGSHTDIFNVGHVIYDLMTLSHHDRLYTGWITSYSRALHTANNGRLVPVNDQRTLTFARAMQANPPAPIGPNVFSAELVDLIFDCLKPEIGSRPSIDDLRNRTRRGLARCERAALLNPPYRPVNRPIRRARNRPVAQNLNFNPNTRPNVSYRIAHFNAMPRGPHAYGRRIGDYGTMMSRAYVDGGEPDLTPPAAKWAPDITAHGIQIPTWPHGYTFAHDRIWWGIPPVGAAGPATAQAMAGVGPPPPSNPAPALPFAQGSGGM